MLNKVEIKIFGKKNCAKCQAVKEKLQSLLKDAHDGIKFTYYDMDTVDGLTEATYYGVSGIPTTIIDCEGIEAARWSVEVPRLEDIKQYLKTGM
jgi:thiol-disulfide isomerase/thioredoxin